jgi:transposase
LAHKEALHNMYGSPFLPGLPKPDIWLQIQEHFNMGLSLRQTAAKLGVSHTLVKKVRDRLAVGEIKPQKVGRKKGWRKLRDDDRAILETILISEQISSVNDLRKAYKSTVFCNLPVSNQTIYNMLRELSTSRKNPDYEHPNKWKNPENRRYYDDFVSWQKCLDDGAYLNLCFHDEVRVEKNSKNLTSVAEL